MREIEIFVSSKLPWILEKQRLARQHYRPRFEIKYIDGERFMFLGKWHRLIIEKGSRRRLTFDGNCFMLSEGQVVDAEKRFVSWYRGQAREIMTGRVEQYAGQAGSRFEKIKITGAKTRWGSCSSRGTLSFSWRLVMAPIEVIDYVVIHELSHIGELNHSHNFWSKVSALCPDRKKAQDWLKENQDFLTLCKT